MPWKMITNKLRTKAQRISYTAGQVMEKMKTVLPPESAFTQKKTCCFRIKGSEKTKGGRCQHKTYQDLLAMSKPQLKKHSQQCAWYPYCWHQVWSCGGYNQKYESSFVSRLTTKMREEVRRDIGGKKKNKKTLQKQRQQRALDSPHHRF